MLSMYYYDHPSLGRIYISIKPRNKGINLRCSRSRISMSLPSEGYFKQGLRLLEQNAGKLREALEIQQKRRRALEPSNEEKAEIMLRAVRYLPGRLAELASIHGFSYGRCSVRWTTSRWGSCSAKGNISLSARLMELPQKYIDYVLLHELCHTRQMNHGPLFWAEMERVLPGSRALMREMNAYCRNAFSGYVHE